MKYIPILFALFILASCQKDKEEEVINFNGTYQTDLSYDHDAVVLYTNKGIIKDTNIIKRFVTRNGPDYFGWGGIYPLQEFLKAGRLDSLSDPERLTITNDTIYQFKLNYLDPEKIYDTKTKIPVRVKNNTLLMVDTMKSSIWPGDEGEFSCTNALSLFRKYQPVYNCVTGYCTGYNQQPIIYKQGNLTVPFFFYFLKKKMIFPNGFDFCFSSSTWVADMFNDPVINKFQTGDTLMLIRYYRNYIKQ